MSGRLYAIVVVSLDLCVYVCTLCGVLVFTDVGTLRAIIAANLAAVAVNIPLILLNLAAALR